MTRLSVNINKIALLRNSRNGQLPDLIQVATDCEKFGAQGITVHPRPDQRHIRFDDLPALKKIVTTELNIEGYPSDEFMSLVIETQPSQVTLVPDPPGALTSDHGWDTKTDAVFLKEVIRLFKNHGIRTSLFVDADIKSVQGALEVGADRIELYTGIYAHQFSENKEMAVRPHTLAALEAQRLGIGVNAGHDLNLHNLRHYKSGVVDLLEVSIGHALICDAIYLGLKQTIQLYLDQLKGN